MIEQSEGGALNEQKCAQQVTVEGKPKAPWSWFTAMQNQVEGWQAAGEAGTPTEEPADSGTCVDDDRSCGHNSGPPASGWGSEETEAEDAPQTPRQNKATIKEKQVE